MTSVKAGLREIFTMLKTSETILIFAQAAVKIEKRKFGNSDASVAPVARMSVEWFSGNVTERTDPRPNSWQFGKLEKI